VVVKVGMSQTPFVKQMVDYLQVISEHGAELDAGSWRLGLAVEAPHTPADETAKLAYFVRRQPDSRLFQAAVSGPTLPRARSAPGLATSTRSWQLLTQFRGPTRSREQAT
jgi:hypothetical protein